MDSMNSKNYNSILESSYEQAELEFKKDNGESYISKFKKNQRAWLLKITDKAESLKAIVTALVTSLVKKIESPNQDIRYHKQELKAGYSARTLDTGFVTPFFKKHFIRLAMKESGWLTRSIEQPQPFTLKFRGKIRDKKVKESFLKIIDDLETNKADPKIYLTGLFILLIQKTSSDNKTIAFAGSIKLTTIDRIVNALKKHFFRKYSVSGASRLPVIALFSVYQILIKDISRYKDKTLLDLRSHISPDTRAKCIGDIEIVDKNQHYFEAVEIKHGIPINEGMIIDAFEKFKTTPINRYYLLTTAEPNIKKGGEESVLRIIEDIRTNHGCEVIVNGLLPSLKYYLRLIDDASLFIEKYNENLQKEFSKTTEIKSEHIKMWQILLTSFNSNKQKGEINKVYSVEEGLR